MRSGRLLLLSAVLAVSALAAPAAHAATPQSNAGVVIVNLKLGFQGARAAGTGMVLTSSGEVLTNNHVIAQATSIRVKVPSTQHSYTATVVGYDVSRDTALLQLNGASGLRTVATGDSSKVRRGAAVRAVGNAGGTGHLKTTRGSVLRVSRTIVAGDELGSERLHGLIESSAPIRAGDSGGPLFDAGGRVIGMNTAGTLSGLFSTDAATPDGFAIPINRALSIARQIRAGHASKTVHLGATAFLGVEVSTTSTGRTVIAGVARGAPAEGAGIRAGDRFVSIAGRRIKTVNDVSAALYSHHPGDQVHVTWTDLAGGRRTAVITLAAGPPQ
jgi:S1-C subfamily serine protease